MLLLGYNYCTNPIVPQQMTDRTRERIRQLYDSEKPYCRSNSCFNSCHLRSCKTRVRQCITGCGEFFTHSSFLSVFVHGFSFNSQFISSFFSSLTTFYYICNATASRGLIIYFRISVISFALLSR